MLRRCASSARASASSSSGTRRRCRRRRRDLLCRYGEVEVLEGTLERLGEVLRQPRAMRSAIAVAWSRMREFEESFLAFYPQLVEIAGAPEFRL